MNDANLARNQEMAQPRGLRENATENYQAF
jgi:hypothetical protein